MGIDGRVALFKLKGFATVVMLATLLLLSASAYSQQMKLFSAGRGWVLINAHLYWTNNEGKNWKDITPPHSEQEAIMDVFFLDESHGWATIQLNDGTWEGSRLAIWNGTTWHSIPLDNSNQGNSIPTVQFANAKHGWLFLWYQHSQGVESPPPSLSVTDDGGVTWKNLPTPPAFGSIELLSRKDAILADSSNPFTLWLTTNGGKKWIGRDLPPPPSALDAYYPIQREPVLTFRNTIDGTFVAQLSDPELTVLYSTKDGGKTWRLNTVRPYTEQSFPFAACAAGSELVTFEEKQGSSDWEIVIHREDGLFQTTILSDVHQIIPQRCEFVDRLNGWLIANSDLFSTSDGKHFRLITPAAVRQLTPTQP